MMVQVRRVETKKERIYDEHKSVKRLANAVEGSNCKCTTLLILLALTSTFTDKLRSIYR
uniref:Uncharacterized protein n=1 Tax=Rhizophora mucronata TaxID=61149 RepID=A0A2P2Q2U7_RHIMU